MTYLTFYFHIVYMLRIFYIFADHTHTHTHTHTLMSIQNSCGHSVKLGADGNELRNDPEDNTELTLRELMDKYADVYSKEDIKEYWEGECHETD